MTSSPCLSLSSLVLMMAMIVPCTDAFATPEWPRPALHRPATQSWIGRRRHKLSVSSSLKVGEATNEWGIPESKSLPPLLTVNRYSPAAIPNMLPNGGRVTMVGSGPGDPDLLTVSTHRLLTDATRTAGPTMVIADRLVSKEILALISPDFEVKVARKLPGCAELAQEEIYWWAYQALNQGKHVIRLKIGDPFVFGRGGEEVLCFRRFGVEPVVIPVRGEAEPLASGRMRNPRVFVALATLPSR
jgi:Tetrapyrrole (Corrin/Porphyrin) Methylases